MFRLYSVFVKLFSGSDRAGRATILACAAVDANVGINDILCIALGNSGYGANSRAGTAHYALVRYYMCHIIPPC